MCTLSIVPFMRLKQSINTFHFWCVFVVGCAVGGAAGHPSLCFCYREYRHWKEWGDEVTAKDLSKHETQTCVGGPEPKSRDQWRAVRHYQPSNQRVERWWLQSMANALLDQYTEFTVQCSNTSWQASSPTSCVNWLISATVDPSGLFWMETLIQCGLNHSTQWWMTTRCEDNV